MGFVWFLSMHSTIISKHFMETDDQYSMILTMAVTVPLIEHYARAFGNCGFKEQPVTAPLTRCQGNG